MFVFCLLTDKKILDGKILDGTISDARSWPVFNWLYIINNDRWNIKTCVLFCIKITIKEIIRFENTQVVKSRSTLNSLMTFPSSNSLSISSWKLSLPSSYNEKHKKLTCFSNKNKFAISNKTIHPFYLDWYRLFSFRRIERDCDVVVFRVNVRNEVENRNRTIRINRPNKDGVFW